MSETKRYYWLKLDENFFDDDTIMFIEEQENGILYSNFYLKLCLKSIKNEGSLFRLVGDTVIPYDDKSLAKMTRTDIDTVRVAMSLFEKIGLVKILDTGEIYMSQIQEMIGTETNKAQLMRAKRARDKLEGNNVTPMLLEHYPELEKELDLKLEKEKDIETPSPLQNNYSKIAYEYWKETNMYYSDNEISFLTDFKLGLEIVRGIHSDDVLHAIKNYASVLKDDKVFHGYKNKTKFSNWVKNIERYLPKYFDIKDFQSWCKEEEKKKPDFKKMLEDAGVYEE